MAGANETRGEIALRLGEKDYVLRPDYQALSEIERITGKGILMLASLARGGSLTLAETGVIAAECIRAHGRATGVATMQAYDAGRVAELIMETKDGIFGAQMRLMALLTLAATGGYTSQGELKAGETLEMEPTPPKTAAG